MIKPNLKNDYIYLILIFIIFLFIRLFSNSGYFFIQTGDDARYLALAQNFPYHTLFNDQLFISQQPLYPYLLHFVSFFFEDHTAGIFISFVSSIFIFFIIYKLVGMLTNNRYVTFGTLVLYSLSDFYVRIAVNVLKESFAVMLTLFAIYFYIKFIKFGKSKELVYSSVFAAMLGLTTDHSILLIPSFIVIFLMFGSRNKILHAAIPLASVIVSYSIWLLVRIYVFAHYEYYPAAVDGNIVKTTNWGVQQVLSPNFFPEVSPIHPFGMSFDPLHYAKQILNMLKLAIIPWLRGLSINNPGLIFSSHYLLQVIVYAFLAIAATFGTYKIIEQTSVKRLFRENGMLLIFILFAIFLIPSMQLFVIYRYTITAVIFLFVIVNYGIFNLANKFKALNLYRIGICTIITLLLVFLPFYYVNNSHFLFSKKKVVEAMKTSELLNELPKNGIMAKNGYPPELSYLTKKRVVALPLREEDMYLINMFNISYIVFGDFYEDSLFKSEGNKTLNYYIKKYIREHPKEFRLLQIVKEDYISIINQTDNVYVYETVRG